MEYKSYIIDHCLGNVNKTLKTNNSDATKQYYRFQRWTDSVHQGLGNLLHNRCIYSYMNVH